MTIYHKTKNITAARNKNSNTPPVAIGEVGAVKRFCTSTGEEETDQLGKHYQQGLPPGEFPKKE